MVRKILNIALLLPSQLQAFDLRLCQCHLLVRGQDDHAASGEVFPDDILQQVRTLVSARVPAGSHVVSWDGRDAGGRMVASGIYLCRAAADNAVAVERMLLVK